MSAPEEIDVLGGPGTGKTTYLIVDVLRQIHDHHVDPNRIAYISHTRAAVKEARSRTTPECGELEYWRTSHSLAFKTLGLDPDSVISLKELEEFEKIIGERIVYRDEGDCKRQELPGRNMLDVWNYERALKGKVSRQRAYEYKRDGSYSPKRLDHCITEYEKWKERTGLVDFTDMLLDATEKVEEAPWDIDFAYWDECQDLSLAQHILLRAACRNAKRIMTAGDENQAIHSWQGAPLETYRTMPGRRVVLTDSHRTGIGAAYDKALHLESQIVNRTHKLWLPDPGHITSLTTNLVFDEEMRDRMATGEWLLLARTNHLLKKVYFPALEAWGYRYDWLGRTDRGEGRDDWRKLQTQIVMIHEWQRLRAGETITGKHIKTLREYVERGDQLRGPFHSLSEYSMRDLERAGLGHRVPKMDWYDAMKAGIGSLRREYLKRCELRGELGLETPRIWVGTIHSAKGLERDNVYLLPDITPKIWNSYWDEWRRDGELRVWYVALTRARKALYIAPIYYSKRYFDPLLTA